MPHLLTRTISPRQIAGMQEYIASLRSSRAGLAPAPSISTGSGVERLAGLHPLLARRSDSVGNTAVTVRPGYQPAHITLSNELVAIFAVRKGGYCNTTDLGQQGLSTHQAWDRSAKTLLATQRDTEVIRFQVRDCGVALDGASLRGLEVHGGEFPAASWLAHPQTFRVIDQHFRAVLNPATELSYLSRDLRELFVVDSPPAQALARVPAATVMTYSVGFPLVCN